ncbi:MAG: hypothetical protein AAGA81_07230 [Acidobacteriota bacterium]
MLIRSTVRRFGGLGRGLSEDHTKGSQMLRIHGVDRLVSAAQSLGRCSS